MDRRSFLAGAVLAAPAVAQIAGEKKPLRVGLIGAGARGTYLADTTAKMGEQGEPVQLAAVCDLYQPRLERAEVKYKAKGYAKTADMLRDAQLDAVMIATPDRQHILNTLEAIRAGKDV